jgi:hypothetical protein
LLAAGAAFAIFVGFLAGLPAGFLATLAGFDVLPAALDLAGALRAVALADLPEGLRFRDVAIAAFLVLLRCRLGLAGQAVASRAGRYDLLGGGRL